MALKTSELNAKLFGKTNKRRVATPQEAQTAAKDKAQTIELAVAGENTVQFELVRILRIKWRQTPAYLQRTLVSNLS